jgi:hypothetical protein
MGGKFKNRTLLDKGNNKDSCNESKEEDRESCESESYETTTRPASRVTCGALNRLHIDSLGRQNQGRKNHHQNQNENEHHQAHQGSHGAMRHHQGHMQQQQQQHKVKTRRKLSNNSERNTRTLSVDGRLSDGSKMQRRPIDEQRPLSSQMVRVLRDPKDAY